VRVATYNIRNVRALDWSSLWWRRRGRVEAVVGSLGADLIGMQEAYPSQIRWIRTNVLQPPEWGVAGSGRDRRGGGEAVPLWHRRDELRRVSESTRWFGPTPDEAGSRIAGARFPRIATIVEYDWVRGDTRVLVVNVHLDSADVANRTRSLEQLAGWIGPQVAAMPTIVLGDFNAPTTEPGFSALVDQRLRSALPADAGPTSNGFGKKLDRQRQIDHVFVSAHFRVVDAGILVDAGYASDHYPVVVDLSLRGN
jgi:endonuclease/exonuclease/phosphatase family metal-dependent hydrolase